MARQGTAGSAWRGAAGLGMAWRGLAWRGAARRGMARHGLARNFEGGTDGMRIDDQSLTAQWLLFVARLDKTGRLDDDDKELLLGSFMAGAATMEAMMRRLAVRWHDGDRSTELVEAIRAWRSEIESYTAMLAARR
jgi:hypothetical protein